MLNSIITVGEIPGRMAAGHRTVIGRADGTPMPVRSAYSYTGAMSNERLVRLVFGGGIVERRRWSDTVEVYP